MKYLIFVTLFGLLSFAAASVSDLRMLTWAIRLDSKPDSISVAQTIAGLNSSIPSDEDLTGSYYNDYKEVAWSTRRIALANEILFNKVQIFAAQGGLTRQISDLSTLLGSDWSYVGVGRDDGVSAGEWQVIFYNTVYITEIDSDHFWLSDTPSEPSKYSGAGSIRMATRGKFKLVADESAIFTVFSTHMDDVSDAARELGASLIRYRAAYEAYNTDAPVFLLGCLNTEPDSSSDDAYEIATGHSDIVSINATFSSTFSSAIKSSFYFLDLAEETDADMRSGHHSTVTGWTEPSDFSYYERTSFALGGSNGGWIAKRYRVGENFFDTEYHMSNHRPLYVDVSIGL
ncbi:uncharacterized protein V2V93DRAFT_359814 [Kockiozyma suomiensis]|uniref:uncharacterized protein n=1 Tax=Kockiozyma suomiensis TaxID=1337062 RepID=UPI0033432ABA